MMQPHGLGERVDQVAGRGDWDHALDLCQQWICDEPENAEGFHRLSSILLQLGRNLAALKASQTAVFLKTDEPCYLTQLSRCFLSVHKDKEAYETTCRAVEMEPKDAGDLNTLGTVFTHLGRHDQALSLFRRAVAGDPNVAQFHSNLASSLHFGNQTDEAEAAFRQAIALDSDNYRARWSISQLHRQSDDSNHIEEFTGLLDRPGQTETAEMYLSLALAKEHEDLGQFEHSFDYLVRGNRIVRRTYPHDEEGEIETFDNLHRIFDAALFDRKPVGHAASAPIFIVGLPRTGSTLLEQILGRHGAVFPAGEMRTFNVEFTRMCRPKSGKAQKRRWQEDFASIDFAELGQRYMDAVRFRVDQSRFFTDKYPINYQLAGAIALALPEAKIIHTTRDPMDTCFSNFKQLFSPGSCRYSYDLESMGRHFLRYRNLMDHWHQVLPGRILDVAYEELVTDPETTVQRVLNHCDLDWQDASLDFDRPTQPVATASTAQVRQPVHQRGIGRWKHHADKMTGLMKLLGTTAQYE